MSHDETPEHQNGEKAAQEDSGFKRYFKRKQYDLIEKYFEEGESVPWLLQWHTLKFVIDRPKFTKWWGLAEKDTALWLSHKQGLVEQQRQEDEEYEEARHDREVEQSKSEQASGQDYEISDTLLRQIRPETRAPFRSLSGRGRIDPVVKERIGILNIETGECTEWTDAFDEIGLIIIESEEQHIGVARTEETQEGDPCITVIAYVPAGTLEAVRNDYFLAKDQHICVGAEMLLWESQAEAMFGSLYRPVFCLLEEEDQSCAITNMEVADDETDTAKSGEADKRLNEILESVKNLRTALWVGGALIVVAVLLSR